MVPTRASRRNGVQPSRREITDALSQSGSLPSSFPDGIYLMDKPAGLSSFGVIRELRRIIGIRKIGHAGTLDPFATGLLVCLAGRMTKQASSIVQLGKVYSGTMRLGASTASHDPETVEEDVVASEHVETDEIRSVMHSFVGTITQLTPMYSAVKVKGERLYAKARRGETVPRPPRIVQVDSFDVTGRNGRDVDFKVACSTGTYVRVLAHDVGQQLGVGAYLTALRRTRIGDYAVDAAWQLEVLRQAVDARSMEHE